MSTRAGQGATAARARRSATSARVRRRRLIARMTVAAFVWSLGLLPAALLVPVETRTESGANGLSLTRATLVGADGVKVLIPVALPALLTFLIGLTMRRRYRTGRDWSTPAAWVMVAVLAVLVVVSNLSLGAFIIPTVLLVGVALALLPRALPPSEP